MKKQQRLYSALTTTHHLPVESFDKPYVAAVSSSKELIKL